MMFFSAGPEFFFADALYCFANFVFGFLGHGNAGFCNTNFSFRLFSQWRSFLSFARFSSVMNGAVATTLHHFEILYSVIEDVSIDMMDYFIFVKAVS